MFVETTFSERYEPIATTARNDPASALGKAMNLRADRDGFSLRARFVAIAYSLASGDLDADMTEFLVLKNARDGLVHKGVQPDLDAQSRRSRALLLKLLGLELQSRVDAAASS
jgi:hypothetical protein